MRADSLAHLSDAVLLRGLNSLVMQDRQTTAALLAHKACEFSGNSISSTSGDEANLSIVDCEMADVEGCRFNSLETGAIRTGIACRNSPAVLGNSVFAGSSEAVCRGIVLSGATGGPTVVLGNLFRHVREMLVVENGVQGVAIYPQFAEDSGALDSIVLPTEYKDEIYGIPHIVRDRNVSSQTYGLRGFQVPTVGVKPEDAVSRDGMIAFKTTQGDDLIVRVGGAWRKVELDSLAYPPP